MLNHSSFINGLKSSLITINILYCAHSIFINFWEWPPVICIVKGPETFYFTSKRVFWWIENISNGFSILIYYSIFHVRIYAFAHRIFKLIESFCHNYGNALPLTAAWTSPSTLSSVWSPDLRTDKVFCTLVVLRQWMRGRSLFSHLIVST